MARPQTDLAQWLRSWRTARGLTQEQLAASAQLSKRDIERYEGGKTTPRGDGFLLLLDALGLTVEGLPQGPRAINAEIRELRRELAALRRTLDRRLEGVEGVLGDKADATDVQAGLEAVRDALEGRARNDEASESP